MQIGRRNRPLPHRNRDLVKSLGDVTNRIDTAKVGSLFGVHDDAPARRQARPELRRKRRVRRRAEGDLERVECLGPPIRIGHDHLRIPQREVVRLGDQGRAALLRIHHHDAAQKSGEIEGRRQPGGAATDNDAINDLRVSNHGAVVLEGFRRLRRMASHAEPECRPIHDTAQLGNLPGLGKLSDERSWCKPSYRAARRRTRRGARTPHEGVLRAHLTGRIRSR